MPRPDVRQLTERRNLKFLGFGGSTPLVGTMKQIENFKEAKEYKEALEQWSKRTTDVHTEHCCLNCNYCKYRDENCTVLSGKLKQSYPCEDCVRRESKENFLKDLIDAVLKFDTLNSDPCYENSKSLYDSEKRLNDLKKEFMDNYIKYE